MACLDGIRPRPAWLRHTAGSEAGFCELMKWQASLHAASTPLVATAVVPGARLVWHAIAVGNPPCNSTSSSAGRLRMPPALLISIAPGNLVGKCQISCT